MGGLGTTELFIILIIVLLLFGAGRVARIGGELGSAIREFRRGIQDGDDDKSNADDTEKNSV